MKYKKIELYNAIRVFSTLLVVFGHSAYYSIINEFGGINYSLGENSSLLNITFKIIEIIYLFHMPLFMFLSGALFVNEVKKYSLNELIQKKFKSLIIPYVCFGVLYVIPIKFISHYYTLKQIPNAVVNGLLFGKDTLQHLWFLPTLFFITLFFYVVYICILKKNNKNMIFLLIILFIFLNNITIVFPGG